MEELKKQMEQKMDELQRKYDFIASHRVKEVYWYFEKVNKKDNHLTLVLFLEDTSGKYLKFEIPCNDINKHGSFDLESWTDGGYGFTMKTPGGFEYP